MIRFSLVVGFLIAQANFAIVLGAEPELKLVNVVFRHGDRTPGSTETYPTDPYANYTYYPIGRGGLTNEGKRRQYALGKLLKLRYGDFLGSIYDPTVLVARSSDMDRTKMSLQLVLSALYAPDPIQEWNDHLAWQPIPAVYSAMREDILFFPQMCPQYIAEYTRVKRTSEVQEKIAAFKEMMTSLEEITGQTTTDTLVTYGLYQMFDAQRSANLTIPEWVYKFYPDGALLGATTLEYEISSYNDYMKRIYGGTLLREITDNAVSKVNGTLEGGRKLYLYSGHEISVASLQSTLGVYKPHVPSYSSAVIIELLQLENEYFFKVLHYTGVTAELITQQIPGCSELCPVDKFLELLNPVIATDNDLLCS